jgi:hypothetical protein
VALTPFRPFPNRSNPFTLHLGKIDDQQIEQLFSAILLCTKDVVWQTVTSNLDSQFFHLVDGPDPTDTLGQPQPTLEQLVVGRRNLFKSTRAVGVVANFMRAFRHVNWAMVHAIDEAICGSRAWSGTFGMHLQVSRTRLSSATTVKVAKHTDSAIGCCNAIIQKPPNGSRKTLTVWPPPDANAKPTTKTAPAVLEFNRRGQNVVFGGFAATDHQAEWGQATGTKETHGYNIVLRLHTPSDEEVLRNTWSDDEEAAVQSVFVRQRAYMPIPCTSWSGQ